MKIPLKMPSCLVPTNREPAPPSQALLPTARPAARAPADNAGVNELAPRHGASMPDTARARPRTALARLPPPPAVPEAASPAVPGRSAGAPTPVASASLPTAARDGRDLQLARIVYRRHRFFHGTGERQALAQREAGMSAAGKAGEETSLHRALALGHYRDMDEATRATVLEDSAKHTFVTKEKGAPWSAGVGARDYANLASADGNPPRLLRPFLAGADLAALERDPDSAAPDQAFRTASEIDPSVILPQRRDGPRVSGASEAFRQAFNGDEAGRRALRIDTTLGAREAAELLHEIQTDSATDFPEPPPWTR